MKRADRIKLDFTRHWKLPGKERLSRWFKPSTQLSHQLKNGITWLTDEDIAIYTTADNYIEWQILSNGTYEDEIAKLIRISLPTGGIALDVGGNIGLQSIRMAQAAGPSGSVFAFEPLEYLQEKFSKNLVLNHITNVTLFPYALAETLGEAEFRIDRQAWNQGTFSLSGSGAGKEYQQISIRVGDELPEMRQLQRLDLIKIDVEGFELPVLRGLKHLITKFKPRIIFEYDENYWLKTNQNIAECVRLLRGLEYNLYQITQVGCELISETEQPVSGNIYCLQ